MRSGLHGLYVALYDGAQTLASFGDLRQNHEADAGLSFIGVRLACNEIARIAPHAQDGGKAGFEHPGRWHLSVFR